ncbi:hypothetical protein GQX74_009546 [Glossina fuscipes]|nr:hypothetical protein GQX74_009546 [Glossina fuscipes]
MTVVEENAKKQSYLTINAKNETPTNLSADMIECVEELLESDKIMANVKEKSLQVTNEVQVQQLSFGVDRLLNRSEDTQFKIIAEQCESVEKLCNEAKISVKCCDNANSSYSCCSYPKYSVASRQADVQHSRHLTYTVNSWQITPAPAIPKNKIQDAFMDSKNIIRPTPIRALGNPINDSGNSISNLFQLAEELAGAHRESTKEITCEEPGFRTLYFHQAPGEAPSLLP